MDKSDKILAAIEQLAQNLTGQIAAVRTELKADIARVDAKVDAVAADVAVVKADVTELKAGQAIILDHLDVAELKGRVEEQSRTIAQLIPTRVAAVPGR
ncbi:hypothetical protein WCLP8_890003 [uncultured Gammaproteobacteria bacterium]